MYVSRHRTSARTSGAYGSLVFRWGEERKAGKGLCWCDPAFKLITVLQLLLAEAERTVVLQYLRALMQGRLVCRGVDERSQAAERLRQDAAQLKELFLGLVRAHWEGRQSRISVVGSEPRAVWKPCSHVFRAWRRALTARPSCSR